MTRIAINGLGRIGKLVLRDLIDHGAKGDIVLINEPNADAEQLATLIEFDSVHGRWGGDFFWADGSLTLKGQKINVTHEKNINLLALKKNDIVICTALIPGKPAPRILSEDLVKLMKPGSIVYDLAAEQGGNSAYSEAGKINTIQGIKIIMASLDCWILFYSSRSSGAPR